MCGIAGIIALENKAPLDPGLIVKMNDSLRHRGPDGEGFMYGTPWDAESSARLKSDRPGALVVHQPSPSPVWLAHRRLSIIDLSPLAAQPMSNHDGSIWIVFNGEIYNHREIRQELAAKGYPFKTDHSDTETIIYAYQAWGIDCLHKFRGMFAIAIWDRKADTTWLIRDRIGIKPLYYAVHDGRLHFASEIKAILKDRTVPRKMNLEGLYHYLSFLTVPAPQTMFEGIYKLPAGHRIKITGGKVGAAEQWWDVFDNTRLMTGVSQAKIMEGIVENLNTAVKYRMEADVPVGVFLSGGIDSSLNATLFSRIATTPVKAFTIGYEDDHKLKSYQNEFQYSRKVAKSLGCDYHELSLTQKDFLDFLPKLIHHQDEPIADPVCVPVYFVSKLAKDNGVTVAQVGEGSDELFWGYEGWKSALQAQDFLEKPLNRLMAAPLGLGMRMAGKQHSLYHSWLERASKGQRTFWGGAEAFYESHKRIMFSKEYRPKVAGFSSWDALEPHYRKFLSSAPEKTNLNWMSYIDLKMRLPELLLMRVDKMSMAVALEGRVPFLDHKFVEYSMSIPTAMKTRNGESKHILKKAVEGILPDEIIYRKKRGFGAPVYDWFFDHLGTLSREKIAKFNSHTGVFDDAFLEDLYARKQGDRVWFLMNLALWWEAYILNEPA